jgi:hypothetical protein
MIPKPVAAAAFIGILASLVGYLLAAREGRRNPVNHPDDYFLARNRITESDLGDTQIAYALQMSTVYPFFMLAASGAWLVPVVNSLFWFFGIVLYRHYVPHFRPLLGRSRTMHAFVADTNDSVALRRFASALTIIAFLGVVIFEIVYGASVFRVLFGEDRVIYYLIIASMTAYLMTYIWNGGQTATLRTEQVQLLVAYLGLHLSLAHMFSTAEVAPGAVRPLILLPVFFIASLFMLWSRIRAIVVAVRHRRLLIALAYGLMVSSLSVVLLTIVPAVPTLDRTALFSIDVSRGETSALDFTMMLGTAALIPLFWQFVDLSNWQRICALTAATPDEYERGTRNGLLPYLIESPLSWLIPILLGLSAPLVAGADSSGSFEGFLGHFMREPGSAQVVGVFLVAGVVGVFMSTADSAITAIGYAFAYDMWSPSRSIVDKPNPSKSETQVAVDAGRWFMCMAVGVVVGGFIVIDWFFNRGAEFIGLLFAFYTPLVALTPAVFCPMRFGVRPHRVFTFIGVAGGAGAGLCLGFYSVCGHPELQWFPAPVAFLVSWVTYGLGLLVSPRKVGDGH